MFNVPKVKEEIGYGFVGVFPPTGPMHLISILSLQAGHTSRKMKEN
jgi:hypothetical protein